MITTWSYDVHRKQSNLWTSKRYVVVVPADQDDTNENACMDGLGVGTGGCRAISGCGKMKTRQR